MFAPSWIQPDDLEEKNSVGTSKLPTIEIPASTKTNNPARSAFWNAVKAKTEVANDNLPNQATTTEAERKAVLMAKISSMNFTLPENTSRVAEIAQMPILDIGNIETKNVVQIKPEAVSPERLAEMKEAGISEPIEIISLAQELSRLKIQKQKLESVHTEIKETLDSNISHLNIAILELQALKATEGSDPRESLSLAISDLQAEKSKQETTLVEIPNKEAASKSELEATIKDKEIQLRELQKNTVLTENLQNTLNIVSRLEAITKKTIEAIAHSDKRIALENTIKHADISRFAEILDRPTMTALTELLKKAAITATPTNDNTPQTAKIAA